jgi:hypothetical protein
MRTVASGRSMAVSPTLESGRGGKGGGGGRERVREREKSVVRRCG